MLAGLSELAEEKTKPNEKRLREYRDSALPSLEQELFSSAPIYKSLDTVTLADSLAQMQEALGADNPAVKKVLNGQVPRGRRQELDRGHETGRCRRPQAALRRGDCGCTSLDRSADCPDAQHRSRGA